MEKLEIKPTHKPVEKVIDALASRSFSRAELLKKLERFYLAIEQTVIHSLSTSTGERVGVKCRSEISDFSQKQQFLDTVHEKFFQGFCVKVADTQRIVYALLRSSRVVSNCNTRGPSKKWLAAGGEQ